ncbi:hypothetical protein LCGC14_2747150, partial [marine sediment metagenome]
MTSEICAKCGMLKTSHPTRYCEKFKPQNHSPQNKGNRAIKHAPEDTEPDVNVLRNGKAESSKSMPSGSGNENHSPIAPVRT